MVSMARPMLADPEFVLMKVVVMKSIHVLAVTKPVYFLYENRNMFS